MQSREGAIRAEEKIIQAYPVSKTGMVNMPFDGEIKPAAMLPEESRKRTGEGAHR